MSTPSPEAKQAAGLLDDWKIEKHESGRTSLIIVGTLHYFTDGTKPLEWQERQLCEIRDWHNAATAKLREELDEARKSSNPHELHECSSKGICEQCRLRRQLAHQQPSVADMSHWEPTLRDIRDRANSDIVRRHAALALESLTGVTSPQLKAKQAAGMDARKWAKDFNEMEVEKGLN